MEVFTVRNLTFTYPDQEKKALDGLSFSVGQGEFITLAGPSGSGKSTLLRQMKTALASHGTLSGEILFEGRPLWKIDQREQSARIGFVMQNPDNQIVTDKVWHELAFGLESLGCDTPAIRCRVAEMASFFGIQTWFYKNVTELSGGQKQLLNLASIMAMQPSVLILDEPTSRLDPIMAADFLAAVGKVNRELGTTVIITEHRLEEVFPMSDRVLVMDSGRLVCEGTPREIGGRLKTNGGIYPSLPAPMRIYAAVPNEQVCPVTVRDGRLWLEQYSREHVFAGFPGDAMARKSYASDTDVPSVILDNVWFRYEKDLPDVLRGLSLRVRKGEFLAVLGGNGSGKTTMLSLISCVNRPYRGKVFLAGKEVSKQAGNPPDGLLGALPQNPQALFVKKTLQEDLLEILKKRQIPKEQKEKKLASVSRLCRLDELLFRHPYDLSGGEQQRAALAKVLLLEPEILLLDEPTKGLDAGFKLVFAGILERLLCRGMTVIMVSHDIEFCAQYAHNCAMFFDGRIVTENTPRAFFSGNSFYTTSASRMARNLLPGAVTAEDVIAACGGKVPGFLPKGEEILPQQACFEPDGRARQEPMAALPECEERVESKQVPMNKRRLTKRTLAAVMMILFAIPLTIYFGISFLGGRKYYFISLLIVFETMIPFFLIFEGRRPQARELIIVSVLCALGVAGRAAFFMLPHFKPVAAIVIISGVAFGGETGFLVGAVTMLISNIMYGQGSWTPWQMFAMGFIGFLAGVLFRKGTLSRSRLPLCIFGGVATFIVYGGVMNPSYLLMYQANPSWAMLLSAYLFGFPLDLVHACATAIFLWFASRPMLEKMNRIQLKYGLIE